MTKLNSLLNYLIKNSFYEEATYLFKLANDQSPEEYLEENYPNIYAVSLNDSKPAAAYIQIINQFKNKGYSDEDIKGFQVNNFQELIAKLKEKKTDPKKEFLDEVYEKLKEFKVNISDKELLYAREKGLDPEETIFLVKDETAHPFLIKVDWAFKFNQNKNKHEDLKDKKITDYQNIDEVDKAISEKITYSVEYMKDFYKGIQSKAEETSEVIYNSLNYVVSHSKSKEAAQWWEQSCVSYNPRTKTVDAGLCTARHEDNLYNEYYSDGYLVQIITKSSPSTSTSPETNFKDKNYSWNLISLHILDDGELSQEHGSTVNRLNQDVTPCEIKDALGDEYNEIIEAISNYFNKNFNTQISGFDCGEEVDEPNILKLIKKDELNERDIQFLKDLSSEDYFDYKLDIKFKENYPKIFDINYRDIAKDDPKIYFENNLGKYRNENTEYLELFENALNKLNALSYFEYSLDEKYRDENPKYFNIFEKNLKQIDAKKYFEFKLDEKYAENYPLIHISKHTAEEYFEKKLDEKYKEYTEILKENLKRIDAKKYFEFKLDEKYGEEYWNILESNLYQVPFQYFYYRLVDDKFYKGKYLEIFKKRLNKMNPFLYFYDKLDEKHREYTDVLETKLNQISPDKYFELELDEKYAESYPLIHISKHTAEEYFEKKLDEKYKEYTEILKKNLREVNKSFYFEFKLDEKYAEKFPLIHISKNYLHEYFEKKLDEKYPEGLPIPIGNHYLFEDYRKDALIPIKDLLKKLHLHAYFELELNEKYKEYTDVLKEKLNELDRNLYFKLKFHRKYYNIFPLITISKYTLLEYFKYKFDEKYPDGLPKPYPERDNFFYFKDYPENALIPIKDLLKKLPPGDYFELGLDKKYDGEEYFDILKNNLYKIDSSLYFEFKLDEKYGEKYPDILTAQTADYNDEYGDE